MDVNQSPLHKKTSKIAKSLLGEDMEFDFDMLISKEAGSEVETPWHQDESYWLDLPDKVRRDQENYISNTCLPSELCPSGSQWKTPQQRTGACGSSQAATRKD